MPASEELSNLVFNTAFKGFRVDKTTGLIDTELRLNADETMRLLSHRNDFGYSSDNEMRKDISTVMNETSDGKSLTTMHCMSLLSLLIGTVVVIVRKYEMSLRLIYMGNRTFKVVKDDSDAMIPGDVLYILTMGFSASEPLFFKLYREGECLTKENTVLRIDANNIFYRPPRRYQTMDSYSERKCVTSLDKIYAWHAILNCNTAMIPMEELTLDSRAILDIRLSDMTLGINPQYDRGYYTNENCNVIDDILCGLFDTTINSTSMNCQRGNLTFKTEGFILTRKMSVI